MLQECRMRKKFSMENFRKEALSRRPKETQDRTKWRCLVNKGAVQYEAKRICEAERKRKERKAEPTNPNQSQYSPSLLALYATDSLELQLA